MGVNTSRSVADILSHESIAEVIAEAGRAIEEARKPKEVDGDGKQPEKDDKEKSVHRDAMQDFMNSW